MLIKWSKINSHGNDGIQIHKANITWAHLKGHLDTHSYACVTHLYICILFESVQTERTTQSIVANLANPIYYLIICCLYTGYTAVNVM